MAEEYDRTVPKAPPKIPRFEKREALVEAALASLAALGPARVQPSDLCEELGLSKALVNYHFGGRDGLLAEAMALGYERYVETLWRAAQNAGPDPLERLMAWFTEQIHWTVANAGLAVALNFPHVAAGLPGTIAPEIEERLASSGRRNFTNLTTLVKSARLHLAQGQPKGDEVAVADAAVIGWTCLGMSVWFAGDHTPTRPYRKRASVDAAVAHVRTLVTLMLSGDATGLQA